MDHLLNLDEQRLSPKANESKNKVCGNSGVSSGNKYPVCLCKEELITDVWRLHMLTKMVTTDLQKSKNSTTTITVDSFAKTGGTNITS